MSVSALPASEATSPPLGRWAATRLQIRRVWALTTPYFTSEEKYRAWFLLAAIVVLNLATVYISVLINDWRRLFYDALQEKNASVFWTQLWRFLYLALSFVAVSIYNFYLTQLLDMRWRSWMTKTYLARWLSGQQFYRLELQRFVPASDSTSRQDNPDQRIQEDIAAFTASTVSLSMGLLNSVVSLASFAGILWGLSGAFAIHWGNNSYEIPGFMVWVAVVYCLIGSIVTHYIGRPQIALNAQQQRLEANFRHRMIRVREYSEAVALEQGSEAEEVQLWQRFKRVLANQLALIQAQKRLLWFTLLFGQTSSVFPFLISAPRYFSGAIALGDLMQISSAFGEVQGALNWFVDSYQSLANWRANTDRLTSLNDALNALPATPDPAPDDADIALQARNLGLHLPDGTPLFAGLNLRLAAGDTVLLSGPSGSGKSTLLRSLAGIWPYREGVVERSPSLMFLPQRSYIPEGTLREALAYPHPAERFTDTQFEAALTHALLPEMLHQLDAHGAWSLQLSGGEQQRLAVARVLLQQPRWIIADEATSALDADAEATLYRALAALVSQQNGALLSIAHRPSVMAYHQQIWTISPSQSGQPAVLAFARNPT